MPSKHNVKIILLTIAATYSANFGLAQQDGKVMDYKGNKIELSRPYEPYKWKEINPKTGKEETKFSALANPPLKLNGQKIYCSMDDKGVSKPKINAPDISLADYLIRLTTPEFEKLEDGRYNLIVSNVVIDATGKIAYYENNGIEKIGQM